MKNLGQTPEYSPIPHRAPENEVSTIEDAQIHDPKNSPEYVGLKNRALNVVAGIKGTAISMGKGNYESSFFEKILNDLQQNKYDNPLDAISEADTIYNENQH